MPLSRRGSETSNHLLLLAGGNHKLLLHDLPVHSLKVVPVPLSDQLLLVLHLSVANVQKALMRQKPGSEGEKFLLAAGCGQVRLV